MLDPLRGAGSAFFESKPQVLRFTLIFRLTEAIVLAPFSPLVGQILSGRSVIDSTDLVRFALSPRGFLATFLGATLLVSYRLVEQVGLTAILLSARSEEPLDASRALRLVARLGPRLLGVAATLLSAGLVVLAPFLAIAGLMAQRLLARHDINFYLAERPPEFLTAAGVLGLVAILTIAIAAWLAVRWRLIVPVLLCEEGRPWALLASSTQLVRHNWRLTAGAWIQTELLILVLGLCAAWLARFISFSAGVLATTTGASWALFGTLFLIRTLLTTAITVPGPCVSAAIFATLYRNFRRNQNPEWEPRFVASSDGFVAKHISHPERWLVTFLPAFAITIGSIGTFVGMSELYDDHVIAVTAHRGGTEGAIENTIPAIEEAIEVGAQFAEIDVQMSRDKALVVAHDSDFSRHAGIAKKVWELTAEEIQEIRLTNGAKEGPSAKVPLFDEVLEAARGRIKLNVELKYYGDHQPGLAERVVAAVRAKEMSDQVIIQSLQYSGLEEVRRAAPEIPIGYLFSVNARRPKVLDVDFLSVLLSRANATLIRSAHRRGQQVHVWTVDKPADMERLIDLGVDNLITDRPREALERVRAHAELSSPERTLRRVRMWMNE